MDVGDDERLTAIIESLRAEIHLSTQNIAQLTGVEIEYLECALTDVRSVPIEKRYAIALRCSYLMNAITLARTR